MPPPIDYTASAINRLPAAILIEFKDAWSASYYGDEDAHYDQSAEACISFGVNGAELLVEALIKIIQ
jgi:hypothetical protein